MTNVVITHVDLDGVVSGYLAGMAFDTDVIVSANYHEIQNKLEYIHDTYGSCTLVCTDLNFKPEELKWSLQHFSEVWYFDHHPSSELFIGLDKVNDKFHFYYSDAICATTLVETFMMNNGHEFTDVEKKFLRYVNLYDTWKEEHSHFIYGRMLNDVFWYHGWTHFLRRLNEHGLIDVPKEFTHAELKHCKESYDMIAQVGRTAEWYNTDCGSTVIILEGDQKSAINHLKDHIPSQTGIYYIFYYGNGLFKCSVRVDAENRDNYEMGAELKEYINKSKVLDSTGGHASAAGATFKKDVSLPEALEDMELFDTQLFEKRTKQ